jgi:transcriptional regulator with XRE-family HTH domain
MKEFGEALKEARQKAKKTLRETSSHVGLSVSYMSDIEQGRKTAPDLETVRKLQDFLRVKDDTLLILASEARTKRPTEIVQHLHNRPRLSVLLARARNLSDEELEELIAKASQPE